jgi:predicted RND superfamily exporter protein
MLDYQPYVDRMNEAVVAHTGTVLLAFLVATVVFSAGLGSISTSSGTAQFTQDVPAQQAFEDVQREFGPRFAADTGSTSLVQRGDDVLSKPNLLRMLRAQQRLVERDGLRVTGTQSAAMMVAAELDPGARSLEARIRAVERATPREIDGAVRRASRRPGFGSLVSDDFDRRSASASATIGTVTHEVPAGVSATAGGSPGGPMQSIQVQSQHVVDSAGGDIVVFGQGVVAEEFSQVIFDSLAIVIPAAVVFIVLFLIVAYRDPFDLLLGVTALVMTIVWTFGFTGLVGIPFTQMLIAVPPLLLAVGIDFGIHAVNRYREERVDGVGIDESMVATVDQLVVAFFLVTTTTVIGFGANFTSSLGPIREFGLVASVGIVFTFLVFGLFLPAAKLWLDRRRERFGVPSFGQRPLGSKESLLGRALTGGVVVARRAPVAMLVVALVGSAGAGYYATGVDTSFQQEDFLPPEETPAYLESLPEPFRPGEYTVTEQLNFLEANFESGSQDTVTVYVQGPMRSDHALEAMARAGEDPPSSFVTRDGRAESQSVVDVVQAYAAADPEFRRLVARNDRDGNGIPDDDLGAVFDALLSSPYRTQALNYVSEDLSSARVVYTVESDASQQAATEDAKELARRHRFDATATGTIPVFQAVSDVIFRSALVSLSLALALTAGFLVFIYGLLEGHPALGLVNLAPILVTVATLAGSMRLFGIPFNALTATILSVTIGLGIDYSVHVVHRFVDEFDSGGDVDAALLATVQGTGGALTGSMVTTVSGIGVLTLAITPILGQFGTLTGLSILYSYLSSLLVLPPALTIWARTTR